MKNLYFLAFFICLFNTIQSQTTIDKNLSDDLFEANSENFFTDKDLSILDSLLVELRYQSPLFDSIQYVLNDSEKINLMTSDLSTKNLKQRLELLDQKTPFHISYNPALEKVIKSYLTYRKKYYPSLMAKATYFFPMFEKYLSAYNIPLEMKYLAIVESALNPKATSRVGASGLWQFMYGTGIQYNLKVSSYVDERLDPVKSTIAACQYLKNLYDLFGDWDLALAAYNSGPGNVLKAIKRSGGSKNYWNIRPYLPTETAGYVPAFYATMYIFEYANEHKLAPESPPIYHFEIDTIQVKRTISFEQISEVIDVDTEMLQFLNPSYKLDIIPFIQDKKYSVTLPKKNAIPFLTKENEIYTLADSDDAKREKPLPKYFEMDKRIRYKVKSGDYLGKIARKFSVRVSQIKQWNGLKKANLKIGQKLTIYPRRL